MTNYPPTYSGLHNASHSIEDVSDVLPSFQNAEHAATAYISAGLSVLPVKPDKSPAISTWSEFNTTVPSTSAVHQWYTASISGVGIICGEVSGNLECIDIDEKYNLDPVQLLDQLTSLVDLQVSGLMSRLVHETSINSGHHLVYRCKTIEGSKKLARRACSEPELKIEPKVKSKTLIETRGQGAYFACYPTPGYRLISGSFTQIPEITERERQVLFDCARALSQLNEEEKTVTGLEGKRKTSISRPGDDFNVRGDVKPVLEEYGWRLVYSRGGVEYWRRPGKPDGISASYNKEPGKFYVFSSSCEPLEPFTWYSKFALLALLKHEGNFTAAAQDLTEEGYGETIVSRVESYLNQTYDFRYNEVTGRIEFRSKGHTSLKQLKDYDLNSICRELHYRHMNISRDTLATVLESDYSPTYDPFKDYYESLPAWDRKVDHIAELAATVTLKNPVEKAVWEMHLRKWLVAAVGCSIEQSVTNHTCLTLVGPQGYYKTTWLHRLLPSRLSKYISVGTIDPHDKDTKIHLSECYLISLDELETLNKHDLGTLKSIMTLSSSRMRRPYGRFADNFTRRASFVGSINRHRFLADETGSRRFLVHEIESIDASHQVDMDKVHAQAYLLYKDGFRFWFDKDETTEINKRNESFAVQSTEDELIAEYCFPSRGERPSDWLSATQVAEKISTSAHYSLSKTSARDFGVSLKRAGYPSKMLNGTTRYAVSTDQSLALHPTSGGVFSGVTSGVEVEERGESDSF